MNINENKYSPVSRVIQETYGHGNLGHGLYLVIWQQRQIFLASGLKYLVWAKNIQRPLQIPYSTDLHPHDYQNLYIL